MSVFCGAPALPLLALAFGASGAASGSSVATLDFLPRPRFAAARALPDVGLSRLADQFTGINLKSRQALVVNGAVRRSMSDCLLSMHTVLNRRRGHAVLLHQRAWWCNGYSQLCSPARRAEFRQGACAPRRRALRRRRTSAAQPAAARAPTLDKGASAQRAARGQDFSI
eukprot:6206138-Pleurochrysis_carterae.AAC.5